MKNNFSLKFIAVTSALAFSFTASAKENVTKNGNNSGAGTGLSPLVAGCTGTTAKVDLDVNNVRTTIMVGGDMWWDLSNPKYEVPIGSDKHSVFAGSLWIGGLDPQGTLKLAAQTYRQTGVDFWGGPLDTVSGDITIEQCNEYDKHFQITKDEVLEFVSSGTVTNAIKNWPGNGNPAFNQANYLAPFFDFDGDGTYDYTKGDYPGYSLTGTYPLGPDGYKTQCNDYLFGDQTIWWVFNDMGNIHTETSGAQIGLEIRAQAFAFKTNDVINNMTFYKYQVINRATTRLDTCYFGQWIDPDLGEYSDDYVGCDVPRGLGFVYNGDSNDDLPAGYGLNPPALGCDFFQGPIADLDDDVDNDKDGCVDCTYLDSNGVQISVPDFVLGEQIIMSKFLYYDNITGPPTGNPEGATHFYNYLKGKWGDGVLMTFGGNGYNTSSTTYCNYMFPGNTDPAFPGQDWTEESIPNVPADRRFLQSSGPFTLQPGAVNYVTVGLVWARANSGGLRASVDLVKLADDKAQPLFDNCFRVVDGPDAPEVAVRELNREIILTFLSTDTSSVEKYNQKDPTIPANFPDSVKNYKFQGYMLYQLKDATVTSAPSDLKDISKARLIGQCDVKDGIAKIVNWEYDPNIDNYVPSLEVNGADAGIKHSFRITEDAFAQGEDKVVVNHKTYYFMVLSYAHNEYKKFNATDSIDRGQDNPYLTGRRNVKVYSAIPHIPAPELHGLVLNSMYGTGARITRIEGQGNGGNVLDLTSETVSEILNSPIHRAMYPVYSNARGPIAVKVVDPVQVQSGNFELSFDGVLSTSMWTMFDASRNYTIASEGTLGSPVEQILVHKGSDLNYGLSCYAEQVTDPGSNTGNNGFLEATISFGDDTKRWLTGLADDDGAGDDPHNWIRSGTEDWDLYPGFDDDQVYEGILGGTWAPLKLVTREPTNHPMGPKPPITGSNVGFAESLISMGKLASVDLVIDPFDKSKWSRAPVLELSNDSGLSVPSGARPFNLRKSPSVDKNFQPGDGVVSMTDQSDAEFIGATGMSWFPGYAINLETGERLNIAFGENSSLTYPNSTYTRDMQWNPSSAVYDPNGVPVFGGQHYIYIFGHNGETTNDVPGYDFGKHIFNKLDSAAKVSSVFQNNRRQLYKDAMWVSIPLLVNGKQLLSSTVKVRLRVSKSYKTYAPGPVLFSNDALAVNTTYYVQSGTATYNSIAYAVGQSFTTDNSNTAFTGTAAVTTPPPVNNYNPKYTFATNDLIANTNNSEEATSALDFIRLVPNPYYSYSEYEKTQLDNIVKVTNLPSKCTVTIYNLGGTLVRQFKRDVTPDNSAGGSVEEGIDENKDTSLDWDLKNTEGIPISSGLYLFHVKSDFGERIIKWFAVTRPIDLDNY